MKNLTNKQEKFAQLVATGKTYADAYRQAYNISKNTSPNTIYVKSSRIMDEAKIRLRIAELQAITIERNQATLEEVLNKLPMEFAVEAQKLLAITLEGSVG